MAQAVAAMEVGAAKVKAVLRATVEGLGKVVPQEVAAGRMAMAAAAASGTRCTTSDSFLRMVHP
jgi:hypothetical protein